MLEDMSLAMIGAMTNPKRCIFLVTKTFGKENGIFILLVSWKWNKHDHSSVNVTEDWQIEYINVSIGKLQYYIRIVGQT